MRQYTIKTPYMVGDVHIYTAETEDGLIMFDTGARSDDTAQYMRENIDLSRLKYVFTTHCHVDHCGMLGFLEQNSDAEIFISKYDVPVMEEPENRYKLLMSLLVGYGFPSGFAENTLSIFDFSRMRPKKYNIIEDNPDVLKKLNMKYVRCAGHSQSDLVFLYDGYAVSGDVLLPGIVTVPLLDIDFETFKGRFDNYTHYCDTFKRMIDMKDFSFMPGHRYTINSPEDCVSFYVSKMADRASKLKHRLFNESVYSLVKSLVPDTQNNPVSSYLKASEIVFLKDMVTNKAYLENILTETGLYYGLKDKLDLI